MLDIVLGIGEQNFRQVPIEIRFTFRSCIDDRCQGDLESENKFD